MRRAKQRCLVVLGLCALGWTCLEAGAACDFDGSCSPYTLTQFGVNPPPTVMVGGPDGGFLRLAHAVVGNVGAITFEVTNSVADSVVADFDFRMTPGAGRADGFGFSLINLDYYPASGPIGGESEEPTFVGSVGVGFDIHRGPGEVSDNHVSIHFDGMELAELDIAKTELDLARGGSKLIHAQVTVRPAGASGVGDVTVVLTPLDGAGAPEGSPITVADRFPVPDLAPYDARAHFMGRSGGQSANHDLDNIAVFSSTAAGAELRLSSASYAAVEGGGVAYFTVLRTGNVGEAQTVGFLTSDLSAQSGSDYQSTALTLSFGMGQKLRGVTVPILGDAAVEPTEEFQVELVDPSPGATLGAPAAATVTVADEDAPELAGLWDPLLPWPAVAIHLHLLPTGQVLFWGRDEEHMLGPHPYLWDPGTPAAAPVEASPAGSDIFCSGHTLTADGQVFVAGGHIEEATGLAQAILYDPWTDQWTPAPDMNAGRWYPTATTLADGDVLVVAGSIDPGHMNCEPQVWEAASGTWRDLSTAELCQPQLDPYYPFMYVAPDGRVVAAGPRSEAHYLDTSGTGAWSFLAESSFGERDYGSSVMYDDGRILIVGGNAHDSAVPPAILPSASAEVIDLGAAQPAWRDVEPMSFPRRQLNATVLPDGSVLATGGSSSPGFNDAAGAVLAAELWDPALESWSVLAPMAVPRLYHSTAALLPDGRVVVAGGGQPPAAGGTDNFDAQVYSPPYLFRGPRPALASAPSEVPYGQMFLVESPDAAAIAQVNLLRLSSVTHAFNQNQRICRTAFSLSSYGVMVTAPSDPNACPAGHYMLFLVNADGVPAQAPVVRLCFAAEEVPALQFVGKESLEWDPAEESDSYDVLRGQLSALRAAGDFSGATCIAADLFATSMVDDEPPPAGDGFYYLVAARGNEPAECRRGSLGTDLRDTTATECP